MSKKSEEGSGLIYVIGFIIGIIYYISHAIKEFIIKYKYITIPILSIILFLLLFTLIKSCIQKAKRKSLNKRYEELSEIIKKEQNIEQVISQINEVSVVLQNLKKYKGNYFEKIDLLHQTILKEIILDGKITETEKQKLDYYEKTLSISPESIRNNRNEAYLIAYRWATKDRVLTEGEERVLQNIYTQLDINGNDVVPQQMFLKELSIARQITNKQLPQVDVPFALEEDEYCYFSTGNSSFYKSYRENYVYYPFDEPEGQGKLYITNYRIIITNPDIFCYWIEDIEEIKNHDDTYIYIKDRNRVKPLFLKAPQPYVVKVVINNYMNWSLLQK